MYTGEVNPRLASNVAEKRPDHIEQSERVFKDYVSGLSALAAKEFIDHLQHQYLTQVQGRITEVRHELEICCKEYGVFTGGPDK